MNRVSTAPNTTSRSPAAPTPDVLGSVVEELADPIALTDPPAGDGRFRIRYGNAAFRGLVGAAGDELPGRTLDDVLSAHASRDLAHDLARVAEGSGTLALGPIPRSRRQAGRHFEVRAFSPVDDPAARVFVFRDVTDLHQQQRASDRDRRRLEKLVSERTARVEGFHERLRLTERLASIGTLGAGLCHDMNNLLMPIRGHLDAIEASGLTDDQAEHLWSVREAIDYLQQLTNGLRLFALNPDDPEVGSGVADVTAWWAQLRPLLVRTIPDRIEFVVELDDDLPRVAIALHRLTQAVLNLLLNAVDSIDGPGTISLRATLTDDGSLVQLSVADSGRGMTHEAQLYALDPFFTTKSRGQSTGLGLSLVHGIVHGSGGRVSIESEPGEGTTVTLLLPTASVDPDDDDGRSLHTGGVAVVTIDDPRISACFTSFLASAGFDVDRDDSRPLDSAAVWVTDTSRKALGKARRLAETTSACRIVAYGKRSEAWEETGATVIDSREGLGGIRSAIQRLMLAAAYR